MAGWVEGQTALGLLGLVSLLLVPGGWKEIAQHSNTKKNTDVGNTHMNRENQLALARISEFIDVTLAFSCGQDPRVHLCHRQHHSGSWQGGSGGQRNIGGWPASVAVVVGKNIKIYSACNGLAGHLSVVVHNKEIQWVKLTFCVQFNRPPHFDTCQPAWVPCTL